MNLKPWVALGALLPALAVQAQQPSRSPDPTDPTDPSVAVPATMYQSVLTGYAPAEKDTPTPDKSWRAANDAVAGQPGHAGHHTPAPTQAQPQSQAQRPTPAAAPKDHDKHH